MALENPLPPRPFREQPNARRSIRASGDGLQFTGDGLEREDAFRSSTRIDMKQIVSAGKMSISPSSRDVVMASRAGLFIVDLENPLNVPAFLPQGGMLEMADVQWNPHPNWSEYILSTSGEKLLVWNLKLETNRHIQHTLETHYRAITDINWHTADPSRIATCAMDAWLWLWDLRSPIQATSSLRPTMGLSAFNESATQVKWNYHNPNILASAHNNEILIWDERNGSIPLKSIRAHDSKIYGINWSRLTENEITTCSLDRTIKKWDVSADGKDMQPLETIQTDYPVWRAKNLPFGKGLLSLPHRGRHTLEMYAYGQTEAPVHTFEGFSDVVTEFVWRVRGGETNHADDREFQLITWDRDSVLQFWPIDTSIMQKVGYTPNREKTTSRSSYTPGFSYRDQLEAQANPTSAITAPTHQSGVLKSVKATKGRRHPTTTEPASLPIGSASPVDHFKKPPQQPIAQGPKYGNMTMGKGHGRAARPHLDPLTWYSAVEEDTRRSESVDTSSPTRKSSSRASGSLSRRGRKSARSGSLAPEHEAEQEAPRSLKEEITQAAAKFTSSKLKIVDVNLGAGTRKCTVEMHGLPSLFIRILFTFPDDYPGGKPPNIDIDHIRKIAPRKQANMLRELRLICAQNTHSIEPCIRFLLGLPSQGGGQKPFTLESDSEEDVQVDEVDMKTGGAPKIQQNQPPRERTAQAVFSKNGALVRIVMTDRKQPGSPTKRNAGIAGKPTHLGDLPLALHGLAQMAKEIPVMADGDPNVEATSYNFADSFSTQPGVKHTGILGLMWNRGMPFKPRPKGMATIIIEKYPGVGPDDFDPVLATKFIYTNTDPIAFCTENAVAAARHGRHDYRRLLESLAALLKGYGSFSSLWSDEFGTENEAGFPQSNPMGKGIKRIYQNLVTRRNLQMLAMFAIAILLSERSYLAKGHKMQPPALTPALSEGQRTRFSSNTDYFSLRPRNGPITRTATLVTTPTPLLTPPEIETPPAASTPPQHSSFGTIASKAGAFSSVLYPLFFTGTSEGSEASHKNRGSDPPTPSSNEPPEPIPIPQKSGFLRNARPTRPRRGKSDASVPTPTPTGSGPSNSGPSVSGSLGRLGVPSKPARKATSVFVPTPGSTQKPTITFALVGQPKRHLTSSIPQERWKREGKPPVPLTTLSLNEDSSDRIISEMPDTIRSQLVTHIRFYGELLYRAGLLEARLEVLAITNEKPLELEVNVLDRNHLTIHHLCRTCSTLEVEGNGHFCHKCNKGFLHPACTYCRLPVRGLSRTCLSCNHTTHLKCWTLRKSKTCATGCGCECPENATFNVKAASLNVPSFSPTSPVAYQRYAL